MTVEQRIKAAEEKEKSGQKALNPSLFELLIIKLAQGVLTDGPITPNSLLKKAGILTMLNDQFLKEMESLTDYDAFIYEAQAYQQDDEILTRAMDLVSRAIEYHAHIRECPDCAARHASKNGEETDTTDQSSKKEKKTKKSTREIKIVRMSGGPNAFLDMLESLARTGELPDELVN